MLSANTKKYESETAVFTNGPLEGGLSLDGVNFDSNTMTQGSPGTIENPISYFASEGTIIMLRNQNAGP